jgi:hypothetical protein
MRAIIRFCVLVTFCSSAVAADDAVVVTTLRNPVAKSYRKMVEASKLFEEKRHLAPQAALRFKLLPREQDVTMQGIRLKVETESLAIPLKVSPDQTFALEVDRSIDRQALKENARVIPNRKAGTMTWRADVRTPGLPPDTRRLGDLRLECEVGMKAGLISRYPRSWFSWLDDLLPEGPSYCHREQPNYLFFAERPLFSVTLVDGARREVLSVDRLYSGATKDPDWKKHLRHCDCAALLDRAYFMPLGDRSWSDDTRVELEYMEGPS